MIELDLHLRRGDHDLRVEVRLVHRYTGLFGPSGAGKTTILHAIAGLLRPARGRIVVDGRTLLDTEAGIDVPAHRRGVGVVFQDDRLFPHRTVAGNLRYGMAAGAGDLDRVVALLELERLLGRRPGTLSGGEQRRVALARALLRRPRVLLLDEPLAGLDEARRRQILPFVLRVRDELDVPALHVTHDLVELLQVTDHLAVIEAGRIAGAGPYRDLVHEGVLRASLHGPGLANVLRLRADGGDGLAIEGGAARLAVPGPVPPPGSTIAVAIAADQVALAAARVASVSIRNQVPAQVVRVGAPDAAGVVAVELDAGQPIVAEVTPAARDELGIAPGATLWCLVKSTAIRRLDDPPPMVTTRG